MKTSKKIRNKIKLSVSIILAFTLFMSSEVFAAETKLTEQVKVSNELIIEMAQNLLELSGEDKNTVEVKDIIPVYNVSEQLTGCTAAYYKGTTPYGYVVFDFKMPNYIKEYAIGENIPSVYEKIKVELQGENSISTFSEEEKKIYEGLPLEYNIKYTDSGDDKFINNYGEIKSENEYKQYASDILEREPSGYAHDYDSNNIFLEYSEIPHSFSEVGSIDTAFSYSEERVERETGTFACSVSALANICNQTGYLLNNSLKSTYQALWNATETTTYEVENGITYGSTYTSKVGPGMKKYISDNFGVSITPEVKENPSFSKLSSIVSFPMQSVLCYGILVNGERSGHTVTVDGYRVTNNGGHYLQVANGWDSYLVYLNFDTVSFLDSTSVSFYGLPVY